MTDSNGAKKNGYDVFISYSSRNVRKVRRLAEGLRERGLTVWFDRWELKTGSDIPMGINSGLERARHVIVCMSSQYFASEWTMQELSAAISQDPANKLHRILPVRINKCEIPANLWRLNYSDAIQLDEALISKLSDQCRSLDEPPNSVKPGVAIDDFGNVVVARSEHVRRILQLLLHSEKPGVAVLEPFGFGADQTVGQVVGIIRQQHRSLLPIRLSPDRQTREREMLFRELERDLRRGLQSQLGGPLKNDWLAAWTASDSLSDPGNRFEARVDDLIDCAAIQDRQLLLIVAGLANVSSDLLISLGSLLSRNCDEGLRLLIWGRQELYDIVTSPPDDIMSSAFHRLERVDLGPLGKDEIIELVGETSSYDANVFGKRALELTNGQPGLVRDLLGPRAPQGILHQSVAQVTTWLLHFDHMRVLARHIKTMNNVAPWLITASKTSPDGWTRTYEAAEETLCWLGVLSRVDGVTIRFAAPVLVRLPELLE